MNEADSDAYFAALSPGSDIDHRATPFTGASFAGDARFVDARFDAVSRFGPLVCGVGGWCWTVRCSSSR
ncbi:hypothetical protein [Streptomyces aureocirculatus]|uniref:hypothetical protein n=1 Tax=Streptomyces aureocirculatus TaxID=67275 RepID=UPI0012FF3031|nr:hypothetical protein [Streptomyces aureocirculatus]